MILKDAIKNIRRRFSGPEKKSQHWLSDAKEGILLVCRRPAIKRLPSLRQLAYLPKVLNTREKRSIGIALLVFILSSAIFGIRFYSNNTIETAKEGGAYIEGIAGAPQFINPIFASSAREIDLDLTTLVFSGLLRYNDKQELINDLSESFTVSEDQKQYSFVLRQNVVWHDGAEFGADDVVFTFESIKDQQWKSPHSAKFKDAQIEKIDDRTVKFSLKDANPNFLDSLTIGIVPVHLWENVPAISATLSELNLKPIGTGPYAYSKISREKKSGVIKEYEFEANALFYRDCPNLQTVRVKFFSNAAELSDALRNRQIDGARPIASGEGINLSSVSKKSNVYKILLPQYTAAFFNKKNQILKEKGVREALIIAARKQEIAALPELLGSRLVDGPIIPGSYEYADDVKRYEYDKKKAEELLDLAGFKSQEGGTRKKGDQELILSLKTINDPILVKTAEILQRQWSEVGVKINIEPIEAAVFQKEAIKPRNFDIVLATEYVGRNNDLYSFWHSSQAKETGFNLSDIKNRDIDELLDASRTTANKEERAKKIKESQNLILTTEIPALFLYQPAYPYIVSSEIKGLKDSSLANFSERFNGIGAWYIKTKRIWK
ncbi:peptide ABC transporter substrate-binding protein [Patescibacteria group bacterium]|nr:MAG: peptide ABC transporter substrate-binding protein [Patescibacteria group bacterium]